MIAVHLSGPRCHRQPLAYPHLAPLVADRLRIVADPAAAEVRVFGHPEDLVAAAPALAAAAARTGGGPRVVYLSEEPFWDTVGPVPPFSRDLRLDTPAGPLPVTVLTHFTSAIFDFAQIPYFLLTEPAYLRRYRRLFGANRRLGASDWRARLARAPLRAAFMAENRLSPKLDIRVPGRARGLSVWRTELAIRYRTGAVLRAGRGWPAGSADRVGLPDWHRDKMRRLAGQCRFVSAVENTWVRNYVSEKAFDAFALGAIPLYYGGPGHRLHDVAPAGWLDLHGLSPAAAAAAIDAFEPTPSFLDGYCAAQARLAELAGRAEVLAAERARLRDALLAAFEAL